MIANVVGMLTGATFDTGFKGIGGRFDRRRLLTFGEPMREQLRFARVDTGRASACPRGSSACRAIRGSRICCRAASR